jgi:hypothetical protein
MRRHSACEGTFANERRTLSKASVELQQHWLQLHMHSASRSPSTSASLWGPADTHDMAHTAPRRRWADVHEQAPTFSRDRQHVELVSTVS